MEQFQFDPDSQFSAVLRQKIQSNNIVFCSVLQMHFQYVFILVIKHQCSLNHIILLAPFIQPSPEYATQEPKS